MNDLTPIEALQRSLRYSCKPGSLIYTLIIGIIAGQVHIMLVKKVYAVMMTHSGFGGLTLISLLYLAMPFILLDGKLLDNAIRIRAGMGSKPVPITPFSHMTVGGLLRYFGGMTLLTLLFPFSINFIAGFLAAALGARETFTYIVIGLNILLFLLFLIYLPAIKLVFLEHDKAGAMTSIQKISTAVSDIGGSRYCIALLLNLGVAIVFLIPPALLDNIGFIAAKQSEADLILRLSGEATPFLRISAALGYAIGFFANTINSNTFAFLYPRTDEDSADNGPAPDFHNRRNGHPDYDLSPAASRQQQTPPAQPAAAPSLHKTPPTQPAAAEPDFRLLADADTRDMGIETQKAFALALARADALIRRGDNLSAIALLKTYANEQRDVAAYFPAYARLYRLDPQPALLARLIHSAAAGHRPSYDLIHDTLEHSDPTTLPADSILPLAQQAGKQQHYRTVLNLTRNFAKNHPNHPHLVENYYLAALALAKTGAADKALPLLQQLHTRYPDHPRAAIIAQAIARLQGSRQT